MKNNYKNFNFMNYIAAVILVILCIVQIVPDTSVKAETAENTGDITEIHTAAELVKASENQTGSYRLMADIDMTGIDWTPWDFSGKFDGNGYTILNLSVTKTNRRTMKTYDGNRKEYDTYFSAVIGFIPLHEKHHDPFLKAYALQSLSKNSLSLVLLFLFISGLGSVMLSGIL